MTFLVIMGENNRYLCKDCRNTVFIFYIWRMRAKWYISAIIFSLTLIGAVFQQQVSIPNQEIVLQFKDVKVASEDVQNTLAIVKKQLQEFGVDNIQVKIGEKGKLKITYYSDVDIASIKQLFSKEKNLELHYTSGFQNKTDSEFPIDENGISYDLDVFEIHKGYDTNQGLDGTYVLEIESKSDRFFEPNLYVPFNGIKVSDTNKIAKLTYKVRRNVSLTIEDVLYIIPEVRAGPIS